ncbi:group III truncated hemoglobin [Ascidiaceihabitans sp.]|uniref:group III truncated hemoglobin n=1 Tax=Ascidiaceihabitans sp. TaxID=1872644 RepID=UPI0032973174
MQRFDVTEDDIARVVDRFYTRVRANPELGPIFATHVTDWDPHEAKITRFWANAILGSGVYSGNPMRVHMDAGNVMATHFPTWLALFDRVLNEELPADIAAQWSALAHRIGRGLSMGLEQFGHNGPPKLGVA